MTGRIRVSPEDITLHPVLEHPHKRNRGKLDAPPVTIFGELREVQRGRQGTYLLGRRFARNNKVAVAGLPSTYRRGGTVAPFSSATASLPYDFDPDDDATAFIEL